MSKQSSQWRPRQNAEVQIGGQVDITGCYISEVIGDAFLKPKEEEPNLSEALAIALLRRNLS
ncbi:hypothetical protein AB6806_19470 [Bosea sp. RCC_152_1]|uniref:hypothetical protein n=1 Tax=Bosea sp. RCC_152_1 TaxID=3239228 RepID=UPI003524323F